MYNNLEVEELCASFLYCSLSFTHVTSEGLFLIAEDSVPTIWFVTILIK